MATGGMGDVLTGLCAALAARGMNFHDAASIGSWTLGRSAEILRWEHCQAHEGITAGRVADTLPHAFQSLRQRDL